MRKAITQRRTNCRARCFRETGLRNDLNSGSASCMISTGGSFFSGWRMVRFLTTILPKSAERRKPPPLSPHTSKKRNFKTGQIGSNHILPSRADRHAVRSLVVGPEGEALPHRCRFGVSHWLPVVQGVLAVGDLLDPIGEPTHEFPVVVRLASREVEPTIRGDGPNGTSRYAQLAFQARVVRERLVVGGRLGGNQHGAQQDEVAELGVDHVAMDAHVTQTRSDCDRLVRHDPDLPTWKAVHLHREAHRWVHCPYLLTLQGRNDLEGDLVDMLAGVVEFEVSDRPSRAADRFSIHPTHEAEECLGGWEVTEDVRSLVVQRRAADLDQAGIVGSAVEAEVT